MIPDPISAMLARALDSRMRRAALAVELQMIMGKDRGRIAVWCCRVAAFIPSNPGYEDLLRWCRAMALAGVL